MLAAIGIGILAKQFHVMLGFTGVKGNTIKQLALIPDSIKSVLMNLSFEFLLASSIGLLSLIFLSFILELETPYFT